MIATDQPDCVLELLERNMRGLPAGEQVRVRRLDLLHDGWPVAPAPEERWGWRLEDKQLVNGVQLVICSDIVYDRRVTAGLVRWMSNAALHGFVVLVNAGGTQARVAAGDREANQL